MRLMVLISIFFFCSNYAFSNETEKASTPPQDNGQWERSYADLMASGIGGTIYVGTKAHEKWNRLMMEARRKHVKMSAAERASDEQTFNRRLKFIKGIRILSGASIALTAGDYIVGLYNANSAKIESIVTPKQAPKGEEDEYEPSTHRGRPCIVGGQIIGCELIEIVQ